MQIRKPFVQQEKFLNYFFGEMTLPQIVFFSISNFDTNWPSLLYTNVYLRAYILYSAQYKQAQKDR